MVNQEHTYQAIEKLFHHSDRLQSLGFEQDSIQQLLDLTAIVTFRQSLGQNRPAGGSRQLPARARIVHPTRAERRAPALARTAQCATPRLFV